MKTILLVLLMIFSSMQRFTYTILFCLCMLFILPSCGKDDPAVAPELLVSTEAISFDKAASTQIMHIKTNTKWNVLSNESWCTVSPATGEGNGTIQLSVSVSQNPSTDGRSAVLTITAGTITKQVTISQGKSNLLIVKLKEYDVAAVGEQISVELQTSDPHQIAINADWITKSTARSVSDKTETFAIAANPSFESREGTITFSLGDLSETVTVRQAGIKLNIAADKAGMNSDASTLATKMGIGWNLGNTLEACSTTSASETMWGNPKTTKVLIDGVKAAGFNTIRIPCAWSGYIEDQATYRIKASWLARVKEVADYCVANDMFVIINIHWDGGWLEENPTFAKQVEVNKKQKALWEQIAVFFRDYDEHLLFAGTNEVHAGYGTPTAENITVQLSYNQTFVDAVRSTGGHNTWRNLIVQAYNTNIDLAVKDLVMPTDATKNRTMAEVHYYDPWDFCGDEKSSIYLWGKEAGFDKYGKISDYGQEDWVRKQFDAMQTNFGDKGIPVILGEYGAILRSLSDATQQKNHIESRNYYFSYVTKMAIQRAIVPVYWDNGGDFGLFNRATGEQKYPNTIKALIDNK